MGEIEGEFVEFVEFCSVGVIVIDGECEGEVVEFESINGDLVGEVEGVLVPLKDIEGTSVSFLDLRGDEVGVKLVELKKVEGALVWFAGKEVGAVELVGNWDGDSVLLLWEVGANVKFETGVLVAFVTGNIGNEDAVGTSVSFKPELVSFDIDGFGVCDKVVGVKVALIEKTVGDEVFVASVRFIVMDGESVLLNGEEVVGVEVTNVTFEMSEGDTVGSGRSGAKVDLLFESEIGENVTIGNEGGVVELMLGEVARVTLKELVELSIANIV